MSEGRRARPHYEGDPTVLRVMLRPRWILGLLLALVVAGVFAWLGRWQLEHSVQLEHEDSALSETVRPIADVATPGSPVTDAAAGMVVEARGDFVDGDFLVVDQRRNGDELGAWVTGHFAVEGGGGLAVAIGWAPTAAEAERAAEAFAEGLDPMPGELVIEGRFMPSDPTLVPKPDEDPMQLTTMAPAQLINLWAPFEGPSYAGFLVLHSGDAFDGIGLAAIESVPPLPAETINWLNLFYAAEWIVFAGFAVFFWFRLVRDDWEKTHELALLVSAEQDPAAQNQGADEQ
ncbi:SURF1 family cytochrome oxidase biogenesis protein [Leucobacter soli]|uniref:SURF1-like protein n=1 Tax=Leucobacter soli TaxID=2812850 RepID=A0A916JSB2_9MICO|nr:SURF1 family cytochrome oxidase biogenesis protein [Leucobacter soli]CAG7599717.1 hypothetical protein LEUCIP111803_00319 [Leucobacter soli]